MDKVYYITVVLVMLALISISTRGLPFIFSKVIMRHKWVATLGRQLTASILLLLIIFELKDTHFLQFPYAIPEFIGISIVIGMHIWFKNATLSILTGSLIYILIVNFI